MKAKRFIPLEKRSKREQKQYHASKRGSWDDVNPVTKTVPSKKVYDRKKSAYRWEYKPIERILSFLMLLPRSHYTG
jgi:hypothetical protein